MLVSLTLLILGLAALVAGGSWLVGGASTLAARLGVAPVLIGLTIVAFGTSTPELVVNVSAAVRGNTDIGFGNVVGSNIANVGLLLALTALVAPMAIHRTVVIREIPMMILACLATLTLAGGPFFGEPTAGFSRSDGLMLLLLFGVFLYYTVSEALQQRGDGVPVADDAALTQVKEAGGTGRALGLIVGGLAALIAGGEAAVRGAIGVADALGVPDTVIALSVVAVGTSLPEFATTLTAARRGQGDLAVGNIVGSNIYNLLFIWGLSVAILPSPVPPGGGTDLLVMTGFSLLLLPFVLKQHLLDRLEGGLMLLGYGAYIVWLIVR